MQEFHRLPIQKIYHFFVNTTFLFFVGLCAGFGLGAWPFYRQAFLPYRSSSLSDGLTHSPDLPNSDSFSISPGGHETLQPRSSWGVD